MIEFILEQSALDDDIRFPGPEESSLTSQEQHMRVAAPDELI